MKTAKIFDTERLVVRPLNVNDREDFFDMMGNPKVMNPIPREAMDRETSDQHFEKHLNSNTNSETKVWAIASKDDATFIGIAAFLKNNEKEDEIGYRIREKFWGIGYGTEIVKGLIDYGFNVLNVELITADVYAENVKSIKILDKFFERYFEIYNSEDNCTDLRYKLNITNYL
ncbi:MAG: GNAT family N-acetyltransferase [Crocinitomicaceae bacterium]